MRDVRAELQEIFRQVFDDPTIVLRDDMTAADVEGWDSVTHIDLLIAIEPVWASSSRPRKCRD